MVVTVLGSGVTCFVVKVTNTEGKNVACKVIRNDKFSFIEADIMTRLDHPNLMKAKFITNNLSFVSSIDRQKMIDLICTSVQNKDERIRIRQGILNYVFIIMDIVEDNLSNFAKKLDKVQLSQQVLPFLSSEGIVKNPVKWYLRDESVIKRMFFQTLCGLEYLHINGFVHNDIKPENIFITSDGTIKIADFSHAERVGTTSYLFRCTATYRSPELSFTPSLPSNFLTDIWCLGMSFLYLCTGFEANYQLYGTDINRIRDGVVKSNPKYLRLLSTPFFNSMMRQNSFEEFNSTDINSIISIIDNIENPRVKSYIFSSIKDQILRNILSRMCEFEMIRRININEILSSPYFQSFTKPSVEENKLNLKMNILNSGYGRNVDIFITLIVQKIGEENMNEKVMSSIIKIAINYHFKTDLRRNSGFLDSRDISILNLINFNISS